MRMEYPAPCLLQIEDKEREFALPRNTAIELTKCSCCTVSRIGKRLQLQYFLTGIDCLEGLLFHIDFAANLEIRQLVFKLLHDILDDTRILRHIFTAHDAVAACDGTAHPTVFIADRHGKPIDFLLDDECRSIELLLQICHEFDDFFLRKDILQRKHRNIVLDKYARGTHCRTAHHLCRRIFRNELRIFLFHSLQLQHELIVFEV